MIGVTGAGTESILRGISSLLWPGVVLVGILIFKDELKDLLRRLRKGKVLGQEIELDQPLAKLESEVEELGAKPIPVLPTSDPAQAASTATA